MLEACNGNSKRDYDGFRNSRNINQPAQLAGSGVKEEIMETNLEPTNVAPETNSLPTVPVLPILPAAVPEDTAPKTFAQKLAAEVPKLGIGMPPPANQPGGWARALVAGAVMAHGGGSSDAQPHRDPLNSVLASIGDANTGGNGALSGIAQTLQNRSQRLDNEQKSAAMIARSNVDMLHTQQLVRLNGEASMRTSVTDGNVALATLRASPVSHDGNFKITDGYTSDQLQTMLATKQINPATQTPYPSGVKVVGENKDGTPINRITYSLVTLPEKVVVDKSFTDFVNSWLPKDQQVPEGSSMTGAQFNAIHQNASNVKAASEARDKTVEDAKIEKDTRASRLEKVDIGPDLTNALVHNNGDILAARDAIMADPKLSARYPHLEEVIREKYGSKVIDVLEEKRGENRSELSKFQNDSTRMDSLGKAEAASVHAQGKIDDPATSPTDRKAWTDVKNQSDATTSKMLANKAREKADESKIKEAAEAGDNSVLVPAALNYQLDPAKLVTMRGDSRKRFEAAMLRQDPTWNEATYKAKYSTVQAFAPDGKEGKQITSLGVFAGHTGEANSLITTLSNTNSPLFNQARNKMKVALGQPAYDAMQVALEAVGGEYMNFIDAGHAPLKEQAERVAALLDPNKSPREIAGILRQMAQTVVIRAGSLGYSYERQMGKSYGNMLAPDRAEALKGLGIDISKITGEQSPKPQLPPAALSQLKVEGEHVKFGNGQTWMLQGGKPVQIQGVK